MFEGAYLCIPAEPQIDYQKNRFVVNGGWDRPIFGGPNSYKVRSGDYTVKIISGSGEEWEVSSYIGSNQVLTIKVDVAGKDICDVRYKVSAAPWGLGFGSMKLD